jgi:SAM-dependent methyltransferase
VSSTSPSDAPAGGSLERWKGWLRLWLPGPVRRTARAVSNAIDPIRIVQYRARTGDRRPLPPGALRARSGRPGIGLYVASAERSADELEAALATRGRRLSDLEDVLEFGCGCCRVLSALEQRASERQTLHGCDVDAAAIRWAARNHPAIQLAVTGAKPPLPYADSSFDLVYASSVFTHLDSDAQQRWIEEIGRILRPGGVAMISTQGEYAFDSYRSRRLIGASREILKRLTSYASLEDAGMVFEPYRRTFWNTFNFAGREGPYGFTFNSPSQVRRDWSRRLDVVEVIPSCWWSGTQDLVILEHGPPVGSARGTETTGTSS